MYHVLSRSTPGWCRPAPIVALWGLLLTSGALVPPASSYLPSTRRAAACGRSCASCTVYLRTISTNITPRSDHNEPLAMDHCAGRGQQATSGHPRRQARRGVPSSAFGSNRSIGARASVAITPPPPPPQGPAESNQCAPMPSAGEHAGATPPIPRTAAAAASRRRCRH